MLHQLVGIDAFGTHPATDLERAKALHQSFLERPSNRHHFAHRLHLCAEDRFGLSELLEGPFGNLDDNVIQHRLERRRCLFGDVVGYLVESVSDGELGRDLGDRESGGFRCQSRASGHSRIHFDDHHAAVFGVDSELNVGTPGLDANLADHPYRRVAQPLIFAIGQSLCRGDRDGVARMDSHRIEVLDGANDDDVVLEVAHDLQFKFLPPEDRLFDQNLMNRAQVQPVLDDVGILFTVERDASAGSSEGERRPNHGWKADAVDDSLGIAHVVDDRAVGRGQPDFLHRLLEEQPVFGHLNGVELCADHLDVVLVEHAVFGKFDRNVQRGLPANGRQNRIGLFTLDHLGDKLGSQRLDVSPFGQFRVRHDRRGIRVDQNHLVALFSQGLAGLGSGIVELASLPDDDRARPDDEDPGDVAAFRHRASCR